MSDHSHASPVSMTWNAYEVLRERAELAERSRDEAVAFLRAVADTPDHCYVPPPTIRAARAFLASFPQGGEK